MSSFFLASVPVFVEQVLRLLSGDPLSLAHCSVALAYVEAVVKNDVTPLRGHRLVFRTSVQHNKHVTPVRGYRGRHRFELRLHAVFVGFIYRYVPRSERHRTADFEYSEPLL